MAAKLSNLSVFVLFLFLLMQSFIAQSRTLKSTSQSSDQFFQNLEGSKKGQNVKGLKEVKQYLKTLGYYPNDKQLDVNLTDDFDDTFEHAVKTYQKNYRLSVTGNLDSETIKQIMIPRCGVPDIKHNPSKQTEHDKKSGKLHTVAHFTFFQGMPKCTSSQSLTYTFHSSVQVVDLQVLSDLCSRAFKKWADVSQFSFQEVPQGSEANIVIGFETRDHGDGYPFDGPGMVLAHAFAPENGRFHYDADENWSTNPDASKNEADLESVAVHEIGHLLGLDHSMDPNAIMYAEIPYGTIKRDLAQDDIDGIRALYTN